MSLSSVLAVRPDGDDVVGEVPEGYDVFGIPHGGLLTAMTSNAVLEATGRPDVFSMTTHFLRKAERGPIRYAVEEAGASRRFTSVRGVARQSGGVTLSVTALVGDRSTFTGPTWRAEPAWAAREEELVPLDGDGGFAAPEIARALGLRLDRAHVGFAQGATGGQARVRGVVTAGPATIETALVACDVTPPAVWNALGLSGWVPTLELTAHVRARPVEGPMTVEVWTRHVAGGFLEEDAEVFDAEGTLVVNSRQLARFTEPRAG